jgi:hypothetical protein
MCLTFCEQIEAQLSGVRRAKLSVMSALLKLKMQKDPAIILFNIRRRIFVFSDLEWLRVLETVSQKPFLKDRNLLVPCAR